MYGRMLNIGEVTTGYHGDSFSMPATNAANPNLHRAETDPPIFSKIRYMLNTRTILPKLTVQVNTQKWTATKSQDYNTHGRNGNSNQLISLPQGYLI